jgi:hypothetical protein
MTSTQLWNLSPKDFNEWRRLNDLPKLFSFFQERLPQFNNWVTTYFPDLKFLLGFDFPGLLITGSDIMKLIIYETEYGETVNRTISIENYNDKFNNDRRLKIIENREYVPYINWAQKKFKENSFILADELNKGYSHDISYLSWSGRIDVKSDTTAYLFRNFPVINLGNITISEGVNLNERNLDFVNMDNLTLSNFKQANQFCTICYSSCRNVGVINSFHAFVKFEKCHIEELKIINSNIQDYHFSNSTVSKPLFENSYIRRLSFINSNLSLPVFKSTELYEFNYEPYNDYIFSNNHDTFRRIRTAFQNLGQREEARKFYYFERIEEKKMYKYPYFQIGRQFPSFSKAYDLLKYIRYNNSIKSKTYICLKTSLLVYKFKLLINPKYLFRIIKYKLLHFISLSEDLLWGYGEKPFRPIILSIITILLFSVIYYFSGHEILNKSLLDSIYYSTVTFTTLGYGDITPLNHTLLKIYASIEAFIGIILMGFLVAGLANRSKY